MYYPKDDLHICYEMYCGEGILGYTIPAYRRIYVDPLKVHDHYDKLNVEEHEKQHNADSDNDEYRNILMTALRLRDKGIPIKPVFYFAS